MRKSVAGLVTAEQVAFIVEDVPFIDHLSTGVRPGVEVHRLPAGLAAIDQMAAVLAGRRNLAAIHLVSHGRPGGLALGEETFDRAALPARRRALAQLGGALGEAGALRLYGCEVGAGEEGRAFVEALAQAAAAPVAASATLTGARTAGGDWDLDVLTDEADAGSAFSAEAMASYPGLLGASTHAGTLTVTGDSADFNDNKITDGEAGSTDIPGYTYEIVGRTGSTAGVLYYVNGITTDSNTLIVSTSDGSEFAFKGIQLSDATGDTSGAGPISVTITGYRDGSSTGSINYSLGASGTLTTTQLTPAIFGNVDQVYIGTLGPSGPFVAINSLVFDNVAPSDTTAPTVSSVTAPSNGTYKVGDNLNFTVNWSEAAAITGTPQIALTIGSTTRYATYNSGTDTTATVFRYTIQAGDADSDGVSVGALGLNSGSIKDAAGNNATLTLNSVGSTTLVLVDGVAPTVSSVSVPSNATYKAGDNLNFTVNFSEAATVVTSGGTPSLGLTVGSTSRSASYVSGTGTSALVFRYTVQAGDADSDGVAVGTLSLNSGTIKDAAGNNATLTLNSVGSTTSVLVDGAAPTVSSVNRAGTSPTSGASVDYTVTFAEGVTGVDASDFTLTKTGTADGAISSVTAVSSSVYTVTVGSVTGDGTLRLDLNGSGTGIADSAGNAVSAGYTSGQTYTLDHTAPAVSSVNAPANATYVAGQTLDFTVNFGEAATVTGTPQLGLTLGSTARTANYLSGSGTTALTFRYTVQSGDVDSDGVAVGSLGLNSGTIKDSAGNNATLTLNSVAATTAVLVDAAAPTVSTVGVPSNGTYKVGDTLTFRVNFSESLTVTGTDSSLGLTIGSTARSASYASKTGTSIDYSYTVQAGDADADGVAVGSIAVGTTTIRDGAGNDATLTLNSVGATTSVLVDGAAPTVSSVTVPSNGAYKVGDTLDFTVNFDEAATVTGSPQLALTVGSAARNATYQSGSGTTALTFRYTVQAGDADSDGVTVGALSLNSGTIKDGAGNDATLTLNSVGTTTSVLVDTTAPTVSSVSVPSNATYLSWQNLDFVVNFAEAATVNTAGGTPTLGLTVGSTSRSASYLSGSGTTALTFRYTVQAGETDADGVAVGSLSLNSGTIKDAAGNDATLTLNSVGSTAAVLVDAVAPTVSSVSVPSNGSYKAGGNLDFTVNFSEAATVNTGGGTPYIGLTVGSASQTASYLSGSGTTALTFRYTVQAGDTDSDGVSVGSLTLNGGTIRDGTGNNATLTLNSVAATTAVLVDTTAPSVSSINRVGSSPTNAASVSYTVTFSEAVSGVDASDFTLTATGTASGSIASVTAVSGTTYTVAVNSVSGDGTLRLDLNGSGTAIADAAGAGPAAYASGEAYTVDRTNPAAPTLALQAASDTGTPGDGLTRLATPTLEGTAENGATVKVYDGVTLLGTATATGGNWSYTTSTLGAGAHSLTATATDGAGNVGAASTALALTVDTTAPSATITSSSTSLLGGETAALTFTFAETPVGFDAADVASTSGTISAFTATGNPRIFTATFTPATTGSSATITAPGAGFSDAAGNTGQNAAPLVIATNGAPPSGGGGGGGGLPTTVIDPTGPTPIQTITVPVMGGGPPLDVPLVTNAGGSPLLLAQVPTGYGLSATGAPNPVSVGGALADLIREIQSRSPSSGTDQNQMTGGAAGFLAGLPFDTQLVTQTITPTVIAGSGPPSQPIVIGPSASSPAGGPLIGIVIDATGLPGGSTLQLDNVNFAAVIGDVRLFGGAGQNYVVGDGGSQVIFLGADDDTLRGGGGDDTVGSAGGNDSLFGDEGSDSVFGGEGDDILQGALGLDTLSGGEGRDTLYGGKGDDLLQGGSGADLLRGDLNNDVLQGNAGADSLDGGGGADTLYGGRDNDLLLGGDGDDWLRGDLQDDVLQGATGADVLEGGEGADTLYGGQDGDSLSGGDGADRLYGDRGNDTVAGGSGADRFVFAVGTGADRIVDFSAAEGDRLQVLFTPGSGYASVAELIAHATRDSAGAAVISLDSGGLNTITLVGVATVTESLFA